MQEHKKKVKPDGPQNKAKMMDQQRKIMHTQNKCKLWTFEDSLDSNDSGRFNW